jgi:hypothetical protein
MFFPEFGRLGNDSLCLLLAGIGWSLTLRWLGDERNKKIPLALGLCLALGLLTKAFFLPITVGLFLFFLFRLRQGRQNREQTAARVDGLALFLALPVMACLWYAYKALAYGSLSGSEEIVQLARQGGLLAGLLKNFSLSLLLNDLRIALATWLWGGTTSLAGIQSFLRWPMLALVAGLVLLYARSLRGRPLTEAGWIPVWVGVPFFGGLFYHSLAMVALQGGGATPGWYISILLPFLAAAFSPGFLWLERRAATRKAVAGLLLYNGLFLMAVLWAQMALFAGCAVKGSDKLYEFPDRLFCLDRMPQVIDRLQALGWPLAALACGGAGFLLLAWGTACALAWRTDGEGAR